MTFLEWLAEFIGSFNNSRPGGKAWNPVPIGFYADYIIRQMGATPAQIQKHIERVVEPEVEKDIPFVYIPDINGDQSKGHFLDKTTGQIYTSEQWYKIGPIYTALKKGEITEDEAYEQIGQVPDITGKSPTTAQEDEEEIVDVVDDDTTEELLADTTEEDTTEEVEEVVEDETDQDKESKTNVWKDALDQWRKEAREKAKEQERVEQEKLAELRREKGYDDLSNTGKSIFDKMVEMGLDPDVNNIQYNYTGFGDFGPNYRNISSFFSNYNRWKSEQARKTVESDTPILDSIDSLLTNGISIRVGDKTIKIPIFGGADRPGVSVDSEGKISVTTVGPEGTLITVPLGTPEEAKNKISEKINTSISEGKTKVEDAQEDISSILSLLFGTKKDDEEKETVDINTDVDNKSDVDNNNNNDTTVTSGGSDVENEDETEISDVENEDETEVSLAGLFGGFGSGGKGAQPELGKFQPVSVVNPVAPVSAADMYRRPQYVTKSLFSEYFK